MGKIIIVDDEGKMRALLAMALDAHGYQITEAASGEEAQALIESSKPDVLITDLRMPGISGLDLLKWVKRKYPDIEVIIMTAYADAKTGIEAMRNGALQYVCKPFEIDEILAHLKKAFEKHRLTRQACNNNTGGSLFSLDTIGSKSDLMQEALNRARMVAKRDTTVLILGKSGTGKELIARGIHTASERKIFIPINCGAIPENLLESELFGHEKGAFTGAYDKKTGIFERAGNGTVFLDEIGDISLTLQVKLLRVLQEKEFTRVGGTQIMHSQARIIAATNRNLEEAVAENAFREDLYFRLNVFPIPVPSLVQRREDIADLVHFFLRKYNHTAGIDETVIQYLTTYDWPGNIRELENCIECSLIMSQNSMIQPHHLPEHIQQVKSTSPCTDSIDDEDSGYSLTEMEKKLIYKALRKSNGNKSEAARLLGITRRALYSKMNIHRIDIDGEF